MVTTPDADLLFAGPPCQEFSLKGNKKSGEEALETARGKVFFKVVERIAEQSRKGLKGFCLETVLGATYKRQGIGANQKNDQ